MFVIIFRIFNIPGYPVDKCKYNRHYRKAHRHHRQLEKDSYFFIDFHPSIYSEKVKNQNHFFYVIAHISENRRKKVFT